MAVEVSLTCRLRSLQVLWAPPGGPVHSHGRTLSGQSSLYGCRGKSYM